MKNTFWNHMLGPTDPWLFLACVIFAGAGVFFVLLLGTKLRDKDSPYSPNKFSWNYLWCDNARRIYASALAVILTLRFLPDLMGWNLDPFKALCVGMGWDGILLFIKQKTAILDPKPKP
jgi:hypothetical protein